MSSSTRMSVAFWLGILNIATSYLQDLFGTPETGLPTLTVQLLAIAVQVLLVWSVIGRKP